MARGAAGSRDTHTPAWSQVCTCSSLSPRSPRRRGFLQHSTEMDSDAQLMNAHHRLGDPSQKEQCNTCVKCYYYSCYTGLLNLMRTLRDSINPNHNASLSTFSWLSYWKYSSSECLEFLRSEISKCTLHTTALTHYTWILFQLLLYLLCLFHRAGIWSYAKSTNIFFP